MPTIDFPTIDIPHIETDIILKRYSRRDFQHALNTRPPSWDELKKVRIISKSVSLKRK